MNTLHFKYAVEIEKTRSITQAAENLYMAQPNLSKAIKELENTLGITIFKRTSKGVIPTEQGIRFLECAKQVLIQIDSMEEIHSPEKNQRQRMRISACRSDYISAAFGEFAAGLENNVSIDLYFHETNALNTISNVREHGFELGVVRFRKFYEKYFLDYIAEKNLDFQPLWEFEAAALMAENSPLALSEKLTCEELSETSVEIVYGDSFIPYLSPNLNSSPVLEKEKNICRRICVFDRSSGYEMLSAVPDSFMLTSPMSQDNLKKHGLIQRKCDLPENKYCDLLIYAKNHRLTEAEIDFINIVYKYRNESAFEELI